MVTYILMFSYSGLFHLPLATSFGVKILTIRFTNSKDAQIFAIAFPCMAKIFPCCFSTKKIKPPDK